MLRRIESILIGCRVVKISFQTWDCKKVILIYKDVDKVQEQNSVFGDIGDYIETKLEGCLEYCFFDSEGKKVLDIQAKSVQVYEVGNNADINAALFDVGYEYIGNQRVEW